MELEYQFVLKTFSPPSPPQKKLLVLTVVRNVELFNRMLF